MISLNCISFRPPVRSLLRFLMSFIISHQIGKIYQSPLGQILLYSLSGHPAFYDKTRKIAVKVHQNDEKTSLFLKMTVFEGAFPGRGAEGGLILPPEKQTKGEEKSAFLALRRGTVTKIVV